MRTLRLERQFDVVLVHDAIMYATDRTMFSPRSGPPPSIAVRAEPSPCCRTRPSDIHPCDRRRGEDGDDGRALWYLDGAGSRSFRSHISRGIRIPPAHTGQGACPSFTTVTSKVCSLAPSGSSGSLSRPQCPEPSRSLASRRLHRRARRKQRRLVGDSETEWINACDRFCEGRATCSTPCVAGARRCLVLSMIGTDPYERLMPEALDDFLQLVFVDLRGGGKSTGDPDDLTFDLVADDLDAIRRALGVERVAVLGHSILGVLAIEYAVAGPSMSRTSSPWARHRMATWSRSGRAPRHSSSRMRRPTASTSGR